MLVDAQHVLGSTVSVRTDENTKAQKDEHPLRGNHGRVSAGTGVRSVQRDLSIQCDEVQRAGEDVFFFFCKYVFGALKSLLLAKGRRLGMFNTQFKPVFLPLLAAPGKRWQAFLGQCALLSTLCALHCKTQTNLDLSFHL